MPLIPHIKKQTTKRTNVQHDDIQRARKLYQTTARKAWKYDELQWSKTFARLRTPTKSFEAYPPEVIDDVLEWYCANFGKDEIPKVWTASVFADRFGWLLELYERQRVQGTITKKIKVTPTAAKLAKELAKYGWPKGSETQLPAVVQVSLDFYQPFLQSLHAKKKQLATRITKAQDAEVKRLGYTSSKTAAKEQRLHKLCHYLTSRQAYQPQHFLNEWFELLHERVANWPNWNAVIKPIGYGKEFDQAMYTAATQATGHYFVWDDLKEELT